jgi:hypothetical protein
VRIIHRVHFIGEVIKGIFPFCCDLPEPWELPECAKMYHYEISDKDKLKKTLCCNNSILL